MNEQLRVSERGDSDNVTALEDLEVALNMTIFWRLVLDNKYSLYRSLTLS